MNWNYPYPPKYSAHGLQIIVFGSRQRTNITFLNMLYHAFKITAHSRSYKTEQPNTQQLYVISAEFGATLLLQSFSSLTTSDNFDPFLFDLKIPQKNWMIRGRLIQKRKDGIWLTCEKMANAQERESMAMKTTPRLKSSSRNEPYDCTSRLPLRMGWKIIAGKRSQPVSAPQGSTMYHCSSKYTTSIFEGPRFHIVYSFIHVLSGKSSMFFSKTPGRYLEGS